jgi:hypothetical protein
MPTPADSMIPLNCEVDGRLDRGATRTNVLHAKYLFRTLNRWGGAGLQEPYASPISGTTLPIQFGGSR